MHTDEISSRSYLGTGEVARILNLSIGTVQNLVEVGKLTGWKTHGGHRRISAASLEAFRKTEHIEAHPTAASVPTVGVLLKHENREKLNSCNFSPFFEIKYHNFENIFHVISGYEKFKPNLLLIDFESLAQEADIELFKLLNKYCSADRFFAIILMPLNAKENKITELSSFDNVLLLPGNGDLSWLNGFICGLENPITLQHPQFRL